ncbi:propanediol utilization protein [Candidatus Uhrbacteria bacterium]|nr:propanediol utilization protein [Candidatus Uhrbacteria bacterium]
MDFPVFLQHRHVHLSREDLEVLFGEAGLTIDKPLEQRGQFIAQERVSIHGPHGSFDDVCVIGPSRTHSQVELSASDAFAVGVEAPLRLSGDTDRCPTVVLKTTYGERPVAVHVIVPMRHLHVPPDIAQSHGLSHQATVSVRLKGREETILKHVIVRVHPTFTPAFHLTKDEAAPFWIQTGDFVLL